MKKALKYCIILMILIVITLVLDILVALKYAINGDLPNLVLFLFLIGILFLSLKNNVKNYKELKNKSNENLQ